MAHLSKHRKGLLQFNVGKRRETSKLPASTTSKFSDDTADELDTMTAATKAAKTFLNLTPEEQDEPINRMDLNTVICYNCERKRYFASDCRRPTTSNSKFGSRRNAGRTSYNLHDLAERTRPIHDSRQQFRRTQLWKFVQPLGRWRWQAFGLAYTSKYHRIAWIQFACIRLQPICAFVGSSWLKQCDY